MFNFTSKGSKANQIKLQQDKVAEMEATGKKPMFIGGEQFFKSLRDIGYSNEGQAICDIVDNCVEAGATSINIFLERGARDKIESIAIVDNGTGMSREWLQNAISFGGTSREVNPEGLGRYGMGLSSAGIAFSELLEVFSKQDESEFYRTWIDLRRDSDGYFDDQYLAEVLKYGPPLPNKTKLPEWLISQINSQGKGDLLSGSATAVVLSHLTPERRKWSYKQFAPNLERHMGVIYHKFAGDIEIFIEGKKLEFIDPLFLTDGLQGYAVDQDRALELPSETIIFKDDNENETGRMEARYCVMPPTFALKKEFKGQMGQEAEGDTANSRGPIMREWTGLILIRNGRVIGCDRHSPVRFRNNDYNIGIELSFSGHLDEEFGLTTLKNKVSLSEKAQSLLQKLGVPRTIKAARIERDRQFNEFRAEKEKSKNDKVSAAEKSASIQRNEARKPITKETKEKIAAKAKDNTTKEVERVAAKTGKKIKDVEKELFAEFEKTDVSFIYANRGEENPFVEFQDIVASKLRCIINKDHRFYTYLYATNNLTDYGREAIKLILASFYQSLLQTNIAASEAGESMHDTATARNLLRNWSEGLSESLIKMNKYIENEGLLLNHNPIDEEIIEETEVPSEEINEKIAS